MNDAPSVWMNGNMVIAGEVHISPFDLGLTVGLGVFETLAAYHGKVFALDRHYNRLVSAAGLMGIAVPSCEELAQAVDQVLVANNLNAGRSRVRISISGGVNPLAGGDDLGYAMVTAVSQPEPVEQALLVIASHGCDEGSVLSGVKSASYACHVLAYRQAVAAGADEALVLNSRGALSEGTMSNVFLVKGGKVLTPPLSSGCLAGVTRACVIELCHQLDIAVEESVLGKKDIQGADEIFITSSAREVQAAKILNDDEAPLSCPVTHKLAEAYRQMLKEELGL